MTTDYFIDASAGAGGNGLSPASAYTSILSVAWADGDRAWVRNTHTELLTGSVFLGPTSAFNVNGFQRWASVIGWPQAGYPFYEIRPAAGVTAGWDSDVPSTVHDWNFGKKFPTFQNSSSNGLGTILCTHVNLANLYLQNTGNSTIIPLRHQANFPGARLINVMPVGPTTTSGTLAGDGGWNWAQYHIVEHMILCMSFTTGLGQMFFGNGGNAKIKTLEIHSKSLGPALFRADQAVEVHHIINWSNSMDSIFNPTNNYYTDQMGSGPSICHVRRVSGQAFVTGVMRSNPGALEGAVLVDDYLGQGPVMTSKFSTRTRVASTGEVTYNNASAMALEVSSMAASAQLYGCPHLQQGAIMRYALNVTSGTGITVNLPMYVDSTGVFSLSNGTMVAQIIARGCLPIVITNSHLVAGSYNNWGGSFIAGGSAWNATLTWTPTETSSVYMEVTAPMPVQASSGTGINARAFFGKPY